MIGVLFLVAMWGGVSGCGVCKNEGTQESNLDHQKWTLWYTNHYTMPSYLLPKRAKVISHILTGRYEGYLRVWTVWMGYIIKINSMLSDMYEVAFLLISNSMISRNCTTNFQFFHPYPRHIPSPTIILIHPSSSLTISPIENIPILLSYKPMGKIFFIISKWRCTIHRLTSLLLRRYPSN